MSNLVFNPSSKDYYKAKACVAISMRFNYAGSVRSYRFPYLSFMTWSSSYRAAFCYVLKCLEDSLSKNPSGVLLYNDFCYLFVSDDNYDDFYDFLFDNLSPFFKIYRFIFSPAEKLSFVYKLLEVLSKYNLGEIRYDLASPMFAEKFAIRYAASKYFSDTPFIEIESDFMFKDVLD